MKIFYLLVLCYLIFTSSNTTFSQILPQERFKVLENVGLQIQRPIYYESIIDVCQPPYNVVPNPTGDWNTNVVGLNKAIDSARVKTGWKLIYFSQAGTYRFGSVIYTASLLWAAG